MLPGSLASRGDRRGRIRSPRPPCEPPGQDLRCAPAGTTFPRVFLLLEVACILTPRGRSDVVSFGWSLNHLRTVSRSFVAARGSVVPPPPLGAAFVSRGAGVMRLTEPSESHRLHAQATRCRDEGAAKSHLRCRRRRDLCRCDHPGPASGERRVGIGARRPTARLPSCAPSRDESIRGAGFAILPRTLAMLTAMLQLWP